MRKLDVFPPMRCDKGCTDCCGPVPVNEREFAAVQALVDAGAVTPRDQGPLLCPFYQDGACAIYAVRPLICRAFGHSEQLVCSRGYNTNLPEAVVRRKIDAIARPTRLLHELVPGWKGFGP